ncbi:hypothetical protein R1sor_018978 [Riccia sorocarpa]|uniref:Uncharacterized protein n=1 Tax=Riccia sorocarpa TaxID=122646 RepID=A0ABD3IBT2_9MARC
MSGKGKEPADSGQAEATVMPRIQLDPDTLQLLQTLKLVLKQEQAEELKERDATKALRAVVRSLGQFEGKNISKFLRLYEQEMDMNHVPEEKMINSFALAVVPEMREHVQGIIDRIELCWEFLRAVEPELQEKLEVRLEDKTTESGLTAYWGKPWPVVPKKENSAMEELLKGMKDLSIKFARLEEKKTGGDGKPAARQTWVQRCIWCDVPEHARRDCEDFQENLRQGVIFWKEGKIALQDTGEFLQTNFDKGGMKKIFNDFQAAHAVAVVEAASYGARASDVCEEGNV